MVFTSLSDNYQSLTHILYNAGYIYNDPRPTLGRMVSATARKIANKVGMRVIRDSFEESDGAEVYFYDSSFKHMSKFLIELAKAVGFHTKYGDLLRPTVKADRKLVMNKYGEFKTELKSKQNLKRKLDEITNQLIKRGYTMDRIENL